MHTQAFNFFGPQRLDGQGNGTFKQPTWGHFTGRRVSLEGVKPVTGNGGKNAHTHIHTHTPTVLEVF